MIIAVTGHRPDKLGGYTNEAYDILLELATQQLKILKPSKVLTGMALGWDQAIADACIKLKIKFDACIPFATQDKIWPYASKIKYRDLLLHANRCIIVCEGDYAPNKMQIRNEYMVDNADKVLALYNGTKGGTGNCVKYAEEKGIEVINCWPNYLNLIQTVEF